MQRVMLAMMVVGVCSWGWVSMGQAAEPVGSAAGVGQGLPGAQPLPAERQERLLELFEDEGIDADGDGVLTRNEVRSFVKKHFAAEGRRGPGMRRFVGRQGGGEEPAGPQGAAGFSKGKRRGPGARGQGTHFRAGLSGPVKEFGGFEAGDEGAGPRGRHGWAGRRGQRPGMIAGRLLQRLEVFNAETAPEHFSLARHPEADADGDGMLTDEEWAAFAANMRERLAAQVLRHVPDADTNEDGTLSEDELNAFAAGVAERVRGQIVERHPDADLDGDGTLNDEEFEAFEAARQAEHRARLLERHPKLDADGDGTLSDAELRAFGEARREQQESRFLEQHPEADADGDGKLSPEERQAFHESQRAEHLSRFLERHPEADADGDGTVTREEIRTYRKEHRDEFRGPGSHRRGGAGAGQARFLGGSGGSKGKAGHRGGFGGPEGKPGAHGRFEGKGPGWRKDVY